MARTQAAFPGGVRFSDYLGLGVIAQVFPPRSIEAALDACGVRSARRRDLPPEAMAYCVIAMGLFRQVSTREVLRCLADGLRLVAPGVPVWISGKSSISRARSRLGTAPFEELRRARVAPLSSVPIFLQFQSGMSRFSFVFDTSPTGLADCPFGAVQMSSPSCHPPRISRES